MRTVSFSGSYAIVALRMEGEGEAAFDYSPDDGIDSDLGELYESLFSFDESFHAASPPQDCREDSIRSSKLYSSSCLTTVQAQLLIYQFVLRHSLSNKVFTELLQLLSVLLPRDATLPKTTYLFKKFLIEQFPEAQTRKHWYCTECQSPLESSESHCDCGETKVGRFITVPLAPQIKRLMEGIKWCVCVCTACVCVCVCVCVCWGHAH